MNDQPGVRQELHQLARPSGMVQMNMGYDEMTDLFGAPATALQHIEYARRGMVVPYFHQGQFCGSFKEIARSHLPPQHATVDGDNTAMVFTRGVSGHVALDVFHGSPIYNNPSYAGSFEIYPIELIREEIITPQAFAVGTCLVQQTHAFHPDLTLNERIEPQH
jgi:hypothetical protein